MLKENLQMEKISSVIEKTETRRTRNKGKCTDMDVEKLVHSYIADENGK